MRTKSWKYLLGMAVGVLLSYQSHASFSFVFDYSSPGVAVNQSGEYLLGNNFTVNTPVEVTQLGVFTPDLAPNGGTVPVGIYINSGSPSSWTLVGTIQNITAADSAYVAGQTTYINLAVPLTLGPGLYSVVTETGGDYNSGFVYPSASSVGFNTVGGALTEGTYDIWNYGSPGSLGSPLTGMQTTGPGTAYPWNLPVFGAGTFTATPVPETTTMIFGACLLLPFGASTLRMLRKKVSAA
jgi:hypothetical protein